MREREIEKQTTSIDGVTSITTDSRGIVEMGEWHGYGERTGKKQEGGKKKNREGMESGGGREVGKKNVISQGSLK